jgi:hypothetical protein
MQTREVPQQHVPIRPPMQRPQAQIQQRPQWRPRQGMERRMRNMPRRQPQALTRSPWSGRASYGINNGGRQAVRRNPWG